MPQLLAVAVDPAVNHVVRPEDVVGVGGRVAGGSGGAGLGAEVGMVPGALAVPQLFDVVFEQPSVDDVLGPVDAVVVAGRVAGGAGEGEVAVVFPTGGRT